MRRALVSIVVAGVVLAPAAAAAPPVLRTSVSPRAVLFADPLEATVTVTVDPTVDDPATLVVSTPTGAWTVAARTVRTTHAASLVAQRISLQLVCRSTACLPRGAAMTVVLPAARATVRRRAGGLVHLRTTWTPFVVASRLPAGAATAAKPPFQLQTAPPPPTARVSPRLAATLLDAAAVLLVLAAVALAGRELRRHRAVAADARTPQERALALLREAQTRPPQDRRRALSLLARVSPGPESSRAATEAWSPGDPTPEQLEELAQRIEETS